MIGDVLCRRGFHGVRWGCPRAGRWCGRYVAAVLLGVDWETQAHRSPRLVDLVRTGPQDQDVPLDQRKSFIEALVEEIRREGDQPVE